ncbi:MAG: ROK family protein [Halanaerobiales bacterium]
MKKMNQEIILELIQNEDTISRAEIAEITNLSPATVSNIVKELIEMELVKETKRGESRGGRKPILLELNPEGAYVVGLEWGISEVKAVLLNLNNDIIEFRKKLVNDFQVSHFIQITETIINKFTNIVKNKNKIAGIGIGVHGLVDPEKGRSRFAPHFDWKDVPIKDMVEKKIDYPVLIDNDVRMMALTEKWEGRDNFIFINTGPGIGSAIVIKGNLYYGRDYSAGEFGHMTVIEDGPLCSCGDHGCIESLISINTLVKKYFPEIESDLSLKKLKNEWEKLIEFSCSGDNKAKNILKKAGKYLGTGIANIINFLNPDAIIIGGAFVKAKNIILPVVKERIKNKSLQIPGNNIKIKTNSLGKKAGAAGAGILVLQELFKLKGGD